MKFWEIKNRLRRSLSLRNRTLFVLEKLQNEKKKTLNEVLEEIIATSPLYAEAIEKLADEYPDIKERA